MLQFLTTVNMLSPTICIFLLEHTHTHTHTHSLIWKTSLHMLTFHPNSKPWHQYVPTNLHSHTTSSTLYKTKIFPFQIANTLNEGKQSKQSSAGKIKRLVLTQEGRTKLNTYPDREFYAYPRFVTHVDDGFISTLTNIYKERLRPSWEILDLMSSWISHLPKEVTYKKVVGHGLNAQELAKNSQLDYFFVKDLNQDQKLELESCSFDAVLCTVSVQYLQQPEKVRSIEQRSLFLVS